LHHEVARKAAGCLDDDGASAIAGDVGEHGCETGARLYVVSPAHRCVGELSHEFEPRPLGEGCDGVSLAPVAVFLGSDIRSAGPSGNPNGRVTAAGEQGGPKRLAA
jgi:hypothetical protein